MLPDIALAPPMCTRRMSRRFVLRCATVWFERCFRVVFALAGASKKQQWLRCFAFVTACPRQMRNPPYLRMESRVITKGHGIPRLQELSYLEVTALAVRDGAAFEEIRKRLIDHMIRLRSEQPGARDVDAFRVAREMPTRYARNVSESLKELMRLGLVKRASVPSTAGAAKAYRSTTFALTDEGGSWVALLEADARGAYNALLELLWRAHSQFAGYLRVISRGGISVPLAAWGDLPEPRTREKYIDFLTARTSEAVMRGDTGWNATEAEIRDALMRYTASIAEGADLRGNSAPYRRNQDFVNTCEEALVKLAFDKLGVPLDFISQEILRRWTRVLGVAGFSYHVPGSSALRYWPTARIEELENGSIRVTRSGGSSARDAVIKSLPESFARARREDVSNSSWVPIYRIRADICWRLQIPDAVFDAAILDLLRGDRGQEHEYKIHLDIAVLGSVPPTEMPLRVEHAGKTTWYNTMSLLPKHRTTPTSTAAAHTARS